MLFANDRQRVSFDFRPFLCAEDVLAPSTGRARPNESPMDVDEVISDPDFLQSVLENLPGVDPQSEAIRSAVDSLNKDKKNTRDKSDEK